MKRLLTGAAVLAALLTAAPAADAAYLTKTRAKAKTAQVARGMFLDLEWATDWSVEPSYSCSRQSTNVVDCDYAIYEDSFTCDSTVRNRLSYGYVSISFPYEPDCY